VKKMMKIPKTRKARQELVNDPSTSSDVIREVFKSAFLKNEPDEPDIELLKTIVLRDDVSTELLRDIYSISKSLGTEPFPNEFDWPLAEDLIKGEEVVDREYFRSKEYEQKSRRSALLHYFFMRQTIEKELARELAFDKRSNFGAANLAKSGIITIQTIIDVIEQRPETVYYFIMRVSNDDPRYRKAILASILENKNLSLCREFLRKFDATDEESKLIAIELADEIKQDNKARGRFDNKDDAIQFVIDNFKRITEVFYGDDFFEFLYPNYFMQKWDTGYFYGSGYREITDQDGLEVRMELAFGADWLSDGQCETLAKDEISLIPYMLGFQRQLPDDVVSTLLGHDDSLVAFSVAQNTNVKRKQLGEIMNHTDPFVRFGFARRTQFSIGDLLKILRDPVPAVREAIFNENGVHCGGTYISKIVESSDSEWRELISGEFDYLGPRIAILIARHRDVVPRFVVNQLAMDQNGSTRVELLRPSSRILATELLDEHETILLAGDKLPQVRKYIYQFILDRQITVDKFDALMRSKESTPIQKAVIAAATSDLAIVSTAEQSSQSLVRIGAALNWKKSHASTSDLTFLTEEEREDVNLLLRIRNRQNTEIVNVYSEFSVNGFLKPTVLSMLFEERDAYFGGQWPISE